MDEHELEILEISEVGKALQIIFGEIQFDKIYA